MKIIKIAFLMVTGIITLVRANELTLELSAQRQTCKYLADDENILCEDELTDLIISQSADQQIACEQLPILKKTFGSLKKLINLGVPTDFINDSYVKIAKEVRITNARPSQRSYCHYDEDFFSSPMSPLYMFPYYDEADLTSSYQNTEYQIAYPEWNKEFIIKAGYAKFMDIISTEIQESYKSIQGMSKKISKTLEEKPFLKKIYVSIPSQYQKYMMGKGYTLKPEMEDAIQKLEKESKQKYFFIHCCYLGCPTK